MKVTDLFRLIQNYWFHAAMMVIAAVSVYDTWLIYCFESEIFAMEENPIGLWLLSIGDGGIEIFVRTKLAGTICVLSILTAMWTYSCRIVFPVTTSVATYQMGLLAYLTIC